MTESPKGWHSRGYLPHFDGGEIFQFITFRLHDSVPSSLITKWKHEIRLLDDEERKQGLRKRIELFLDRGYGACYLKRPEIAEVVQAKLLELHENSFKLTAWTIMPNHVHLLLRPLNNVELDVILKKLKDSTAREANKQLGRVGTFWQRDYFDRYIRDGEHYGSAFRYIEKNPVKAGLCRSKEEWRFGSAYNLTTQLG